MCRIADCSSQLSPSGRPSVRSRRSSRAETPVLPRRRSSSLRQRRCGRQTSPRRSASSRAASSSPVLRRPAMSSSVRAAVVRGCVGAARCQPVRGQPFDGRCLARRVGHADVGRSPRPCHQVPLRRRAARARPPTCGRRRCPPPPQAPRPVSVDRWTWGRRRDARRRRQRVAARPSPETSAAAGAKPPARRVAELSVGRATSGPAPRWPGQCCFMAGRYGWAETLQSDRKGGLER